MNYSITKKIANASLITISVFLLSGCGSENSADSSIDLDSIQTIESENTFYSMPSPIQLGQALQNVGAEYDKDILNPIENVSHYTSSNSKALNLGIYSSNLSYVAAYNQPNEIISYWGAAKKLSQDLGIPNKFSVDMEKRLEANGNNSDSLNKIMAELFLSSNEALKEHDQSSISVLVLAGGYIEGMYVGTQVAKTVKDKKAVYALLGEFRGSLNQLVMLLSTINDGNFSDVLSDLKSIKAIYDNAYSPEISKGEVGADGANSNLSDEQVEKLTTLVDVIRTKIVKSI